MKIIVQILLFSLLTFTSFGQPGSPDPSFGINGVQYTSVDAVNSFNANKAAVSVLPIPGGSFYVIMDGGGTAMVAKFFSDGKIDDSFGATGFSVTAPFFPLDATLQADGKIVVVGFAMVGGAPDYSYMIARYNTDGSLDNTFSGDGLQTNKISGQTSDIAKAVAMQGDNIVVSGISRQGSSQSERHIVTCRFNSSGTLDNSFGTNGVTDLDPILIREGDVRDLLVKQDTILIAGYADGFNNPDFLLIRYLLDGSLDYNFAGNGYVTTDFGGVDEAATVALQGNKIVLVGSSSGILPGSAAIARYNNDGTLDDSFSGDGKLVTNFGIGNITTVAGAVQNDKITIGAYYGSVFVIARVNYDGSPDISFSGDGVQTTTFTNVDFVNMSAITLQGNNVIAAGKTTFYYAATGGTYIDYAIAQYSADGSPDLSFDQDGKLVGNIPISKASHKDAVVQSDGKIVTAGNAYTSVDNNDFFVARYNQDGSLDQSFGKNGIQTTGFFPNSGDDAVAVKMQGNKIVVAGTVSFSNKLLFAIARYNADGTLDQSFDGDGMVTVDFGTTRPSIAAAMAIQGDKIIVAGYTSDYLIGRPAIAIARLNLDGSLDQTFSQDGLQTTHFGSNSHDGATSLAIQGDKLVVGGYTFNPLSNTKEDFLVARYNLDGTLDNTFNGTGLQTTNIAFTDILQSIHINGNKILAAGLIFPDGGNGYRLGLAQYNNNGSPDLSFSGNGKIVSDVPIQTNFSNGVSIGNDGNVYVGGSAGGKYLVLRYSWIGVMDNAFKIDNPFYIIRIIATDKRLLSVGTEPSSQTIGQISAAIGSYLIGANNVVYYSKATGNLHNTSSWGSNPDGSGTNPPDFGAGKMFHLANRTTGYTMTANWTVGGKLDIPAGSYLKINAFTLSVADLTSTGTIYGSSTSNLTISTGSGGSVGALNFTTGGASLNNLTLNRSGGSATVGSALSIYGVLTITNGALNTGNNITLKSSATATARVAPVIGTVAGNVTVERYIPARRAWRIMSAPVGGSQKINAAWQEGATTYSAVPNPNPGFGTHITEGSAANGFDHNPQGATVSIKKYISATDSWVTLSNTNATNVNSDAYLLFVRGHRATPLANNTAAPTNTVLRATGPLKTGDQLFPVSSVGFTAIPNPFASPIDFAKITRNNVPNNFYLWDPKLGGQSGVGAYVLLSFNGSTYDITPAPVSPESQLIQSGQGFLVHSAGGGASIVIKEADKSATAATNVFRSAGSASTATAGLRASLQVVEADKTTSMIDEAFTAYSAGFSNNVDDMDPLKVPNINENLAIIRNGQSLMMERRKEFTGNDTIHLQLWNTVQRDYLLRLSPVNLSSSTILSGYLEDSYLHTSTPVSLSDVTEVPFTVDANNASASRNRFRVILSGKKVLPLDITTTSNAIRLSPNPIDGKVINIQFVDQPSGIYHIALFNAMGQQVYKAKLEHAGGTATQTLQLGIRVVKGMYQMRVTNGQGVVKSVLPVLSK